MMDGSQETYGSPHMEIETHMEIEIVSKGAGHDYYKPKIMKNMKANSLFLK